MSRLRLALGVAISVALFGYLLTTVDLGQVAERLRHMHPGWTVVSVLLAPIGLWIRAKRWRYLFARSDQPPGLVPAVMIGYMANNILPLRAGELVRVYVVSRRWGRGFWAVLGTLVVERVLDSLAIVGILAVNKDDRSGQHFIAMEFVEGGNLRDILRARKKLPPGTSVKAAAAKSEPDQSVVSDVLLSQRVRVVGVILAVIWRGASGTFPAGSTCR